MLGWFILEKFEDIPLQVIPEKDLNVHMDGPTCWCHPRMDDDVLVHNAMDGRERIEHGYAKH